MLLAILLGVGVHSSKEALVPSEQKLEGLGLGPVGYSTLTVLPVLCSLVTPLYWGSLWDSTPHLVLLGAPGGELIGAVLIAAGMHTLKSHGGLLASLLIATGLLFSSICRAGVTVAEFSLVGRLWGDHAVAGFGALVVSKHMLMASISWGVPLIFERAASNGVPSSLGALVLLQLVLLIPHAVSVCAGYGLVLLNRAPGLAAQTAAIGAVDDENDDGEIPYSSMDWISAEEGGAPLVAATPLQTSLGDEGDEEAQANGGVRKGIGGGGVTACPGSGSSCHLAKVTPPLARVPASVLLVGLWRAFEIGTLHAYHSIRIEMMLTLRTLSLVDAGALFARNDTLAPFLLPVFVLISPVVGLRSLLVAVPTLSLGALALLTIDATSPAGSCSVPITLFGILMSLLECGAPIIPLALLPRLSDEAESRPVPRGSLDAAVASSSDQLGVAYGAIETLFTLTQITLTMLLGMLRGVNGPQSFAGPISLMAGGFMSAGVVSVLFWTLMPTGPRSGGAAGPIAFHASRRAYGFYSRYRLRPTWWAPAKSKGIAARARSFRMPPI